MPSVEVDSDSVPMDVTVRTGRLAIVGFGVPRAVRNGAVPVSPAHVFQVEAAVAACELNRGEDGGDGQGHDHPEATRDAGHGVMIRRRLDAAHGSQGHLSLLLTASENEERPDKTDSRSMGFQVAPSPA